MIKLVDLDFGQPNVAVSGFMNGIQRYQHVVAVRAASEWNRSTMVEKLVPFAQSSHISRSLRELSDWDKL
jgi:hypothetical protein